MRLAMRDRRRVDADWDWRRPLVVERRRRVSEIRQIDVRSGDDRVLHRRT
jgi:hypothetical protein